MAKPERLLTVGEFAKMMGIHSNTAYKWVEGGKVPYVKMGDSKNSPVRIKESDAFNFQENLTIRNKEREMRTLSRTTVSLREHDRIHLRSSKVSQSKSFWNYGYGAIRTRKTREGIVRYYYRLKVEENGKTRYVEKICKNASSRSEAIKELERAHQDYLEGKYDPEPKLRRGKFEELCNDYLEYCRDEISFSCKKSCINQPDGLKSFFGKMDVSKITSKEVKAYRNMRKEKVNSSDNTTNIHLAVLKNMFSFADEWNWELSNKAKKIVKSKFFVSVPGRTRVLSHEEEKRLYRELSPKHQLITTIALNTMMREGEIMSLKWENIDFEERKIRITLEDTLTKKHRRMLYMNETVFRVFQVLKAQNGYSEWVFPSSRTGTHMTEAQKTFRKAVRRAGIEDFHFHDLRRTCASRLHKAGVPLVRISRDLGHTNLKTTMIYIGLTDEEETQNYFAILDKTNGENQWNSCGTSQEAISRENVSPSNLMA